jgi:hypothetical protein
MLRTSIIVYLLSAGPFATLAEAQEKAPKSFAEQFKEAQEKEQREKTFQGDRKSSGQVLNDAKGRSQANANSCAPGAIPRKSEDVASYLDQEDAIQKRFAISIEKYTQRSIDRNEAINQMNGLINDHNKLVIWSHGKVTNGTCGPKSTTEIIGKAYSTTVNLINEYKRLIGV